MKETATDVVAVVLAYNGGEWLPDVLGAIAAQRARPGHVIVVDNGSRDGTPAMLAAHDGLDGLEVVALPENVGVGLGHALGWEAAFAHPGCRYVWALEHDTVADPDCLARLLETAVSRRQAGERLGVVAARGERNRAEDAARRASGELAALPYPDHRMTFNGVLLPREAIEAVGFPRADFFVGFEDWEYSQRLLSAGFTIWQDPRALILHRTKGDQRFGVSESVLRSYYATRNWFYLETFVNRRRFARLRSVAWSAASLGKIVLEHDNTTRRLAARVAATFDGLSGRLGRRDYRFLR